MVGVQAFICNDKDERKGRTADGKYDSGPTGPTVHITHIFDFLLIIGYVLTKNSQQTLINEL